MKKGLIFNPVRAGFLCLTLGAAAAANADFSFVVNGTSGTLSDQATLTFNDATDTFTILLENTSAVAAANQAQTLSGFYWCLVNDIVLTPVSADYGPGSSLTLNNVATSGDDLNNQWAYRGDLGTGFTPNPDLEYGVSASGLGLFGPGDTFSGTGPSPDGSAYDIIPLAGVTGGGGTDSRPYVNNSVLFTFSTTDSFSASDFCGFAFQYGTALDEGTILVPEPASMAVLAVGGLALLRRRRKA